MKRMRKRISASWMATVALALAFSLSYPHVSYAERFADIILGGSLSMDETITISAAPQAKATARVNFGRSFIIGYRLGGWSEKHRWAGFALDASLFQQSIDGGDIEIIPLSALLMLRLPLLKSDAHPAGELWPYIGLGPSIFFSTINYNVRDSAIPALLHQPISGTYSDRAADIGLDLRAGIAKMLPHYPPLAVFGEYRYSQFKPDFEEDVLGTEVKIATKLTTHHLLVGFTYRF